MCDSYDFEQPEFRDYRWPRAKKEHKCVACYETIKTGELYHVAAEKLDGEVESIKHCARCWNIVISLPDGALYTLDCGEIYEPESDNDPLLELAFWSRQDNQEWAASEKARKDSRKNSW